MGRDSVFMQQGGEWSTNQCIPQKLFHYRPSFKSTLVARHILFWAEIQETIRLKGEDARQINSQSFKKTIKSGTFRKNTLWNKHLSLHTHFSSIYASIHIFKHLSLHTHSSRLITLIKCLKGHKSSTFHVEQPETLIEWKSESVTDQPTNIWHG